MTALAGRPDAATRDPFGQPVTLRTTCVGVLITLPEPVAGQLARWRDRFVAPQLPGVPPHITLLPPTLIPADRLPEVERHLRRTGRECGPFEIHLRGSGTFLPVSPVTFVQLAAGMPACQELESRVRCGPLARSLPFPFHPHVTVAQNVEPAVLDRVDADLARFDARFCASRVDIYQATATGDGPALWSVRARFPLLAATSTPNPG